MSQIISYIHEQIAEFDETPCGYGHRLRNYFSQLILDRLDDLGWTQRKLAVAAGMTEPFISRVVRGGSNCTFEVAGTILQALDLEPAVFDPASFELADINLLTFLTVSETDGETITEETDKKRIAATKSETAGNWEIHKASGTAA